MKSDSCQFFLQSMLSVAALLLVGYSPLSRADTINVAVASNFASTLERMRSEFEAQSGHTIQIIAGSSGRHYAQILNGAPFDLFLSADSERPQALEQGGHIAPAQRRAYAVGRLALWSRNPNQSISLLSLAELGADEHLAIANPRLAPYGQAALEVLEALGWSDRLQARLVMGENITQAFQFAYSGSASLCLVAYSQVLAAPVAGQWLLIPDNLYSPIVQEMALLTSSTAAAELFDYLSSPAVIPALLAAGYYAPSATQERIDAE